MLCAKDYYVEWNLCLVVEAVVVSLPLFSILLFSCPQFIPSVSSLTFAVYERKRLLFKRKEI